MRTNLIVLGLVLITLGGIWALQGGGAWQGSPMSGQSFWLLAGLVAMAAGIVLLIVGALPRRPRSGG